LTTAAAPANRPMPTADIGEGGAAFRHLSGWRLRAVYLLGVAMAAFHIWFNTFGVMRETLFNAAHVGFALALVFLLYPGRPRAGFPITESVIGTAVFSFIGLNLLPGFIPEFPAWLRWAIPAGGILGVVLLARRASPLDRFTWTDLLLAVAGVVATVYVILFERQIQTVQLGSPTVRDYAFATAVVLLLIEATRRTTGLIIPAIALVSFTYTTWWGRLLENDFFFRGVPVTRMLYRLLYTDEGVLGTITTISSGPVFMFILFGAFLVRSGTGQFLIDLATAAAGRTRGGPAKVAVLASGLLGMISGSAVANAVATGSITIPLMKRSGYRSDFAAGVEAAASTGGQIMPPIMGAAAFVIVQFTGIPYLTIAAASIIPAIMYFGTVWTFVHIRAVKTGLQPLADDSTPPLSDVLKRGWFYVLPVLVVIALLVNGYSPTFAATWGIAAAVICSWLNPRTRMGPGAIADAMYLGARGAAAVASILAVSGVLIAVVNISAVGLRFSGLILDLSQNNLFLAIWLIAFASLILGMGLPVTASYVVLAVLAAPALTELGVGLLAAHLIILWYSQDANVTPPVALAAFAAAGIAGAHPMKAALEAWKLAKGLYLIPLLFAYGAVLTTGELPWWRIAIGATTGTLGLIAFSALLEWYWWRRLTILEAVLFLGGGVLLFWPAGALSLLGAIPLALALTSQFLRGRPAARPFPG
jgi:TRAP transporter 4TM/12TM fusion protein